MKKFAELVNDGFSILHPSMVDYIVSTFRKKYAGRWWDEILNVLNDQRDLPGFGADEDLIDCLDIANCCRVFSRRPVDLFYDRSTGSGCKALAAELMGVRNTLAHNGVRDIPQNDAERYLDTMTRLAECIDRKAKNEIRELYLQTRRSAEDMISTEPEGYYPLASQKSTVKEPGINLLSIQDNTIIEKTGLTRKLTIRGETKAYPVYRVRLDKLFYNDKNDRILTWITQYKDENAVDDFTSLSIDEYNGIIEGFIIKSNPAAIERTKNNIAAVNQREPGVTLADGRIIDGNRRFTCLRLLHKESAEINYFETVILGDDVGTSTKDIKMLELSIQHGEEQKVEYNQIELVMGAYIAIEEQRILTIEEYASSTNESVADVKKRLEVARIIVELLEFMNVPGQFHIARDLQVFSIISELAPVLNKCKDESEREQIKKSVFMNIMLGTFADQRRYIRDFKSLYGTQAFKTYIQREAKTAEKIEADIQSYGIGGSEDLKSFIDRNAETRSEQALSFEKALNQSQKAQTRSKPAKNVSRCIDLLMEIDTGVFAKLTGEEKESLKALFGKLSEVSTMIAGEITDD